MNIFKYYYFFHKSDFVYPAEYPHKHTAEKKYL